MSSINRKPIAVAAIVASSIGSALAAGGAAHATSYGGSGANPVTVTANGEINIVGGGHVGLAPGAHDVSWAGQGGRFAFIANDGAIFTADYDGSHLLKIAQGVAPSHTVWDVSSEAVYWTEGTGASAKIFGALANGDSMHTSGTWNLVSGQVAPVGIGLSNADVAADQANSFVMQETDGSGNTGIGLLTYDAQGQQHFTTLVTPDVATKGGSAPTISADGKTIVFVRTDANGDPQLFATSLQGSAWSTPKQITAMTGTHATPIFEGDNQTVAFEYTNRATPAGGFANGTYQVNVGQALAAATPAATLEKSVSPLNGGLAVRTDEPGHVFRLAGADRLDTAVLASHQTWRTVNGSASDHRQQAQAVVLSRSDVFADALGGASLAAHRNGPLLLTSSAKLDTETQNEIQRILPVHGTVYVLGGTTAISPAVTAKLQALGYNVDRVAGKDRFETAVAIANNVDPSASQVLVASGVNYPDALSAGAAAGTYNGMTVVLTNGTNMPASTEAYLENKINTKQLTYLAAIGGPGNRALSNAGWSHYAVIAGGDRYQTSFLVAQELFGGFESVGVATGNNWPDSLSGGALMGYRGGPLLLVNPATGLTPQDDALLDANRGAVNSAFVLGGLNALPLRVDGQLAADLATASGSTQGPGRPAARTLSTPDVAKR